MFDPKAHSEVMKRVRAQGTRIERLFDLALKSCDVSGYVLNEKVPEKVNGAIKLREVDVLFEDEKIAVFLHGCHWHKHPGCDKAYFERLDPKTKQKRLDTENRDLRFQKFLKKNGWRTAVIWECALPSLKNKKFRDPAVLKTQVQHSLTQTTLAAFRGWLEGSEQFLEISGSGST